MTKGKAKRLISLETLLKKGPAGFSYIKQRTGLTKGDAIKEINRLKNNGVHVDDYLNNNYVPQFYINNNPQNKINESLDLKLKEGNYVIGVTSDKHMGDKAFDLGALNKCYDIFEDAGVKFVTDSGDLTTGVGVYTGQHSDLSHHTIDDQIDFVVDNHPSIEGVITHTTGGNHDYSSLKKGGVNPIRAIQNKRDDINFLGWADARLIAGGVSFNICHYKGSMAWSLGYRAQKYLRDCNPTDMPNVLLLGHKHVAMYAHIQGVHSLECGTFQGQNNFTKERGLHGSKCAWLVEYTVEDNKLSRFNPELLTF